MQKAALYGIIAAVVVAAGIGVAFAATSLMGNNNDVAPVAIQEAANQQQTSDSAQRRVVKHVMGETEIAGTPQRIVALDWSASENLLALGVQPVGVANLEGMKTLLNSQGLSPDVTDIGTIVEPNLETISQLKPDLILAEKFSHSELYDDLSVIAPTVAYDNSPPQGGNLTHLEALEQNIILVADAANRRDKGVQVVDALHAKYKEASGKIEAAGLEGDKFVAAAVDPPYDGSPATVRFFDDTFFMSQIVSKLGLENAVTEKYGGWGMKVVGLEGLATVDGPNVHLFYIHAAGQDYLENEWKDNPIWTNLDIAKNGNGHPLGTLYVFGGPKQIEEMVEKVARAVVDGDDNDDEGNSTRTIKHAMGETEVTGIPEKIVVVDDEITENMLTLGVTPVGASLWKTFGTSFEKEKRDIGLSVPSGITNIGDYWTPNLETIAQLEPDLILASDSWSRAIYGDLNEIAPTLMFSTYPSKEGGMATFGDMERDFMTLSDVTGRHEKGTQVLDNLNAKIDDAAERVEAAGLKDHKFLIAEVWVQDGTPTMYLYTKNSVASQTLEKIGLQNALITDEKSDWGIMTTGLEGLASLDDPNLHFFFGHYDTINEADYYDTAGIIKDGPVTQSLEFVQRGQVHELGPEFKPRPTPRHMEVLVERVLNALT